MSDKCPPWFLKAENIVMKFYKAVAYASTCCLFAVLLIAFINVCGEKLARLGLPVTGISNYYNLIAYLHVGIVFLACGYATLDKGHTVVDIFTNHLPDALKKFTAYAGLACGAAVAAFLSYRGTFYLLADSLRYKTTITTASSFPEWPFILIYCFGTLLLSLSFVWSIVRLAVGYQMPHSDEAAVQDEGGTG